MYERRAQNLNLPNTINRVYILEKYQATEKKLLELKDILLDDHCNIWRLEIHGN